MRTYRTGNVTRRAPGLRAALAPLAGMVVLFAGLGGLLTPSVPAAADPPAQGWTTTEAPLPADAGTGATNPHVYLSSSSCPTPTGCVAAGWYDDTSGRPWGLIEMQNGATWSDVQAPQPSNAATGSNQALLLGSQACGISTTPCKAVSCPTASFCVSVGQYQTTALNVAGVIETWSGGTWIPLEAPVPGNAAPGPSPAPRALLESVVCTSPTSCVAVGQYTDASGVSAPMIDTLSGTTWTSAESPLPADANTGAGSRLTTLTCPTDSSCVAVGVYAAASGGSNGLLATLVSGTWSATGTPVPSDAATGTHLFAEPLDASCTSSAFCVVAGIYNDTSGGSGGLVDTFAGGSWTAARAPVPSDAATGLGHSVLLTGVSCGSPGSCVVVGTYPQSAGSQGLIDTLSGGTWSTLASPLPANAATQNENQLQSVSCPSPSFCTAVGAYSATGPVEAGYVDTLLGGTWTAMQAPVPANATVSGTFLSFARYVTCYSPVACNVVGNYSDPGNTQGFLDTWTGVQGYWLDASDGGILTYPNNLFYGSTGSLVLNKPMVGMAATPDGQGYWLVASDGGIFNYGDAGFHGSAGSLVLNKPVVGMASTPDGKGYWLVATDGGIFNYGDAGFYGSTGSIVLNKPVVGMAATPDGMGYWLVASDGGIFAYGDALFYGSTGSIVLNKPVVGMASSATGLGYWLVASDGGIFSYGDTLFYGSTGSIVLNKPVVGMAASPSGKGYWFVASDGGIFNYGDAPFQGSAGSLTLNKPVVGMAAG